MPVNNRNLAYFINHVLVLLLYWYHKSFLVNVMVGRDWYLVEVGRDWYSMEVGRADEERGEV